jgi:hypothetical protein
MAFYYGKIPSDDLAKVIDRLFELWYKAPRKMGVERNNTGIATLVKAKEYVWYYDLYWEKTVDKRTNRKTKKIWRHTNMKTRPLMFSEYEKAVREWLLIEVDERLRAEMYTLIWNDKKKPEAILWEHDDWIIADCICLQMMKEF